MRQGRWRIGGRSRSTVVVAAAVAMLATGAGVAVAHDDPSDPDHESAHLTAEDLGETVEGEWVVTGPPGVSYTIQRVAMPGMWTRIGHNLLAADGERLYGVWDEPECVGAEDGSFRLEETTTGYEIAGSTRDGASAVELHLADTSTVTIETFGTDAVPLEFFRAVVSSRPVGLEPVGAEGTGPCGANLVGGGRQ